MDAKFTPDSAWLVFARKGDLYLTSAEPQKTGNEEFRLTFATQSYVANFPAKTFAHQRKKMRS